MVLKTSNGLHCQWNIHALSNKCAHCADNRSHHASLYPEQEFVQAYQPIPALLDEIGGAKRNLFNKTFLPESFGMFGTAVLSLVWGHPIVSVHMRPIKSLCQTFKISDYSIYNQTTQKFLCASLVVDTG